MAANEESTFEFTLSVAVAIVIAVGVGAGVAGGISVLLFFARMGLL